MATSRTTFTDQKDTFEAALNSFFSGKPEETEADLTRLVHPSFRLTAEFEDLDFPGFVKHITWLRENLPANAVSLTITQFLVDGKQRADRHSSTTKMPDGNVRGAETYLFAEVADDGRLLWVKENVLRLGIQQPDGTFIKDDVVPKTGEAEKKET
ncbi:hypothetical protein SPBR_07958 [Sporothrix brasiliensis 5110]|uniref:SnoaL-like domain-containing protein n=1 Tax=Sporothrix brasiliensis 5110 TaxID=1398154 RepID=A0A0C2IMF1_9PEZI|nr:uncharacterized protein SPBR_07958 [Sporothrix brasiliensis 5110]KIH88200.1 hypothetical protein SPBR_07958 [Sporothrix brasiliensis 5110]